MKKMVKGYATTDPYVSATADSDPLPPDDAHHEGVSDGYRRATLVCDLGSDKKNGTGVGL